MNSMRPLSDQRIETSRTVGTHPGLDLRDPAGGEQSRHESAVRAVKWRVLEDDHAGWELHVVPDQLEQRASGGAVGSPVGETGHHVLVAAERPELVLVVAIERRLVPHPPPDWMRIGVDLEVVRVVVDVGHRRGTEGWSSIVSTSTWRGCVTA